MIKYNEIYDIQLKKLVYSNPYGYYGKLQKCKDLKYLDNYVFNCTKFLDETENIIGKKFATRAVRIFYTLNHIDHQLNCCVCGKPYTSSKYFSMTENCHVDIKHLHCCHKCAMNDQRTQQRISDTFLNHYGVKSCFQAESVKKKIGDTNETRYGVRQFSQSKKFYEIGKTNDWWPETDDMKKKRGRTLRETLANKSAEEKQISVEKAKRTSFKRYGVENWAQSEDYKNLYLNKDWTNKKKAKEINTKIRNGTTNTSGPEESAYKALCGKFGEENVVRQYKSEKYPFFCDFYVRPIDVFVELNLHWTHGKAPFDPNDKNHISILNEWRKRAQKSKFYKIAVDVWTVNDPQKAKIAEENELRFMAFYEYADFESWLSSFN